MYFQAAFATSCSMEEEAPVECSQRKHNSLHNVRELRTWLCLPVAGLLTNQVTCTNLFPSVSWGLFQSLSETHVTYRVAWDLPFSWKTQ